MSPATCIYCGQAKPFSREHAVPRALGTFRGAPMLREKVCRPCNADLGKLDEALVRTAPEALFRAFAGVKGRSGHAPVSPFYPGPRNPDTVQVLGKHPDNPYDVLWEASPGRDGRDLEGREARQVIVRHEGRTIIPIALPKHDIAAFLKRTMRELGLEDAEIISFFADEDEYEDVMREVLAVAGADKSFTATTGEPAHVVQVSSALSIMRTHLRTVTKIALHYLLANVPAGILTGHEPAFDAAKRFILTGEDFYRRIGLSRAPFLEDLRVGRKLKWYAHLLQAGISHTEIVVRAQFFVGPAVTGQTWTIRLASNPSRVYTGSFGHGFMLFEQPASDGHQGEMVELTAIRRSLLPG